MIMEFLKAADKTSQLIRVYMRKHKRQVNIFHSCNEISLSQESGVAHSLQCYINERVTPNICAVNYNVINQDVLLYPDRYNDLFS